MTETQEEHLSRKARRADKVIDGYLNTLIKEYIVFRAEVEDPTGEETRWKFKELNAKWKSFSSNWQNDRGRMKKSDGRFPELIAFEREAKEIAARNDMMENYNVKPKTENDDTQKQYGNSN